MLFNGTAPPPSLPLPLSLSLSSPHCVWSGTFNTIDDVLRVSLPLPYLVSYLKVQRVGFGALSLSEIEMFGDRINTMRTYNEGSPVRTSAITHPYEPIIPFSAAFSNYEINGRWNIIIEQNGLNNNYDSSGNNVSIGTISDVVIIITDYAGELTVYT